MKYTLTKKPDGNYEYLSPEDSALYDQADKGELPLDENVLWIIMRLLAEKAEMNRAMHAQSKY